MYCFCVTHCTQDSWRQWAAAQCKLETFGNAWLVQGPKASAWARDMSLYRLYWNKMEQAKGDGEGLKKRFCSTSHVPGAICKKQKVRISLCACVAWCIPMIFWMCYRECLIHVWLSSSCAVSCLLLKNGEAGSSPGPKRELHRTDTHTGTIFGTEFRFAPGQQWTQTSHMIQQKKWSEKIRWSGFGTIFIHLLLVGKRKIWTKISPRPPCVRSSREYRSGKSKIWMWLDTTSSSCPSHVQLHGIKKSTQQAQFNILCNGVFQKEWKPLKRRREAWNPEPAQLHLIS